LDISEILRRLDAIASRKNTALIAIDGGSGSGKTTLAALLAAKLDCNVFHMDDFYLQPFQRTGERLSEVGGHVDYERFKSEVLDKLIKGSPFSYRPYDCKAQAYKEAVNIAPGNLNIVEGSYSLHPYFADVWDLKIFVSADREIRLRRIKERSGEALFERFIKDWIPREDAYFSKFRIEETSHIMILNN